MMKIYRFLYQAIIALWMGLICITSLADQPLDKVVAVVNDDVITQSAVDSVMSDMQHAMEQTGQTVPPPAELKQQALNLLIDQKLQLQIAARNKITLSNEELDTALKGIAKQNHLTLAQLKEALEKQGIRYAKFRQQVHDQLLIHRVQAGIFASKIAVSDEEAKAYIKTAASNNTNTQYHLEDLVAPTDAAASKEEIAQAQQKATDLLKQAQAGKSFTELASSQNNLQQSDLGFRTLKEIPAVFTSQVSLMKVGSIQGPILAPNGYHLIKLIGVQNQQPALTLTEAKNMVFQQKLKGQVDTWLQQVRRSAYIKMM
ncbi:MAG: SurA N-terminal domain-containing protein [Gammaproteobacteria bacterium]